VLLFQKYVTVDPIPALIMKGFAVSFVTLYQHFSVQVCLLCFFPFLCNLFNT